MNKPPCDEPKTDGEQDDARERQRHSSPQCLPRAFVAHACRHCVTHPLLAHAMHDSVGAPSIGRSGLMLCHTCLSCE
ncbi:MAG: hypothetical protein IKY97_03005 [Mailhella sp.]|nr:hypothetical protein [Mailhella sp.]